MSFDVFETISIKGEESPVVDFTLTDNSIKKYKDTITSCNDDVSKEDDNRTQKLKCHNCYKSFKRFDVLKKHLAMCQLNSGYQLRKADIMKNIMKIEATTQKLLKNEMRFTLENESRTMGAKATDEQILNDDGVILQQFIKQEVPETATENDSIITESEPALPKTLFGWVIDDRTSIEKDVAVQQFRKDDVPKTTIKNYFLENENYSIITIENKTIKTEPETTVSESSIRAVINNGISLKHRHNVSEELIGDKTTEPSAQQLLFEPEVLNLQKNSERKQGYFEYNSFEKMLPQLRVLSNHHRSYTGEKPYTCTECNKSFAAKQGLKIHMMRHTGEKPYTCNECNKSFAFPSSFYIHMKGHSSQKPYSCTECNKSFATKQGLKIHMVRHTGEKPFTCIECNKSFAVKQNLDSHMKRHNGEKPYSCTECTKSYYLNEDLKIHMRQHTGEKPFTCTECNKSFAAKQKLKIHMMQHTGEKPHTCDECNKSFATKRILRNHMRQHTGEKPFTCTECNQCFTRSDGLKIHMRRHTGEKPLTCKECNKSFAFPSSFNIHMKQHSGQKPFACTKCNKSFTLKQGLNRHMIQHTGERPFTCTECNHSFAANYLLNIHMKRHTGEMPHVCNECGKRFVRAIELSYHSKIHVLPFACDQCEEKFKTNKKLEQHIRNHSSKNNHENETQKHKFKCEEINDMSVLIVKNTNNGFNDMKRRPTDCEVWDKQFESIKVLNSHIHETEKQQSQSFHNAKRGQKLELNSSESSQTTFNNVPPANVNVMLSVKSEELTSMKSGNKVTETTTEKLLLENEMCFTLENESGRKERKATDEQISIDDGVILQKFIKHEVLDTDTENDSISMESIITIENKTIKTEPETTVPESSIRAVINNGISLKCGDVSEELIGDKKTETTAQQLLCQPELTVLKVQKNSERKQGYFEYNSFEKKMPKLSVLNNHHRSDTGEKPYTCTECHKSFAAKQKLKIHMMRHTGDKPFTCNECNQSFTVKYSLNLHMRTHTGEKPYTCTECKKGFTRKGSLNIHMKRHAGEKPHVCNECGKRFLRAIYLHYHSKTHIRPFTSGQCEEIFKTNKELEQHIEIHSSKCKAKNKSQEHKFNCKECEAMCATEEEFKIHCNTKGHKDLEKTRIDCVDYGKEFNPCLDKNLIENITTANKNVIHAVKYSEQRSIKGSVVLQKFIKDEISETCTEQLILDNEEITVSTLENQSIKTEPETIVPGSLVGEIMDRRTSIKSDVVEEEFIKEEVNETSTKNLL